ncbi:MAG: DUF2809 domain-containing protein [Planctomycetota bacterium]
MLLLLVAVAIGLGSRSEFLLVPEFFAAYAGDASWAWFAFLLLGLLFPRWSTRRVATSAFLLSMAVELSQLYHAPWIDSIRSTRLGGLALGHGFLWSDLVCYAVGILMGSAIEVLMLELGKIRRSING